MSEQKSIVFLSELRSIIEEVCQQFDHEWRLRNRVLNTYFLVLFVFKLVLSKNKQGYACTLCELWDTAGGDKLLELPQKKPVAASSICEARQKMPETIFQKISDAILLHWHNSNPNSSWNGHQIFAVDGSKLNLPHELSKEGYKIQDEKHRHYPTGLMSVLYNLGERMIYDFTLQSHLDERKCAIEHMDKMSKGDVLVLDRGYFSYWLLRESVTKGIHIICRLQPGTVNGEIKSFWDSDKTDVIIKYSPSSTVISSLKKRGINLEAKKTSLRLIKYTIGEEKYVCATTLMGKSYSVEEFSKLYHGRWGIEELYKISKQHIDVEDFHSRTELGVKQEIYAHLLLINIARIFESEAGEHLPPQTADKKSIEQENSYWQDFCKDLQQTKINFKNCLLTVGRCLKWLFLASINTIADWLPNTLSAIKRVKQKIRGGRHYQRMSHKPMNRWARI